MPLFFPFQNMYKYQILFIAFIFTTRVYAQSNIQEGSHFQPSDTSTYWITGSISQSANDAAMKILAEGGTAMDAALSLALSQNTITNGKYISFAGIMNFLYYEASTGQVHNMNAGWNTLKLEDDPMSIPTSEIFEKNTDSSLPYGRTVLVPGFMKGVEAAHQKFGRVPFDKIFKHAIYLADSGIVWQESDYHAFAKNYKYLSRYPETKEVFTKKDGSYNEPGEIFKQPALSKTLKAIVEYGADYMYKGAWAEKFVKNVQDAGGKLTMEDLAEYKVIWSRPLQGKYNGYEIYTHGIPAYGGGNLLEALNLAEESGLAKMGHYTESPEALATINKIFNTTTFRRYYGAQALRETSKEHAARKWNDIDRDWNSWVKTRKAQSTHTSNHSASIVAIDKYGNMVALIHTINTLDWGITGLFIDGISIADVGTYQQGMIQQLGPGKRIKDNQNPGIVFKDKKPVMGFSCIGFGLNHQTFGNLINILDFKMSPMESLNTPTFGIFTFDKWPFSVNIEPGKFSPKLLKKAEKSGARFIENQHVVPGYFSSIVKNPETGKLEATEVWLK